jgi:SAM (Sterile alpha motif) domain-containing protein
MAVTFTGPAHVNGDMTFDEFGGILAQFTPPRKGQYAMIVSIVRRESGGKTVHELPPQLVSVAKGVYGNTMS